MKKRILLSFFFFAMLPAGNAVAESASADLDRAPIDSFDFDSLQRGAKLYVNYCLGCHSLKYMRFTRAGEDLAIPDEIMQANMTFGGNLFVPIVSAMDSDVAKDWFNQAEPLDLSLTARSRGEDWIYTYLRSFYRDSERPSGWNNEIFKNVAMPNPLHSLQGSYRYNEEGERIAVSEGLMSIQEFDTAVADIVNFLVYVAEPARNTRHRIGYGVMIFLSFLLVIVYALYREYWREVK